MSVVQITSFFVCIAASVVTNSPNEGPLKWKKHYDSTKQSAQTARRPMLLVLENPEKKSEKIDETKLTEKQRDILAKERFELCRVNVNTAYGKRVAAAFGARVFPYTVVTDDSSKRIVFRKPGPMSKQDWTLALAKSTRHAVAPPAVTQPAAPVTVHQVHPPAGTVHSPAPIAAQGWTDFGNPTNGFMVIPQAATGTCFT